MGVRELRAAFNEVTAGQANCVTALMGYKNHDGVESQILYFSGNYSDGSEFVVQSDPIRPSVDLVAASRDTAQAFLQKKRAS